MSLPDFVTIRKHAELTGFSEDAIRANIKNGKWKEGEVWVKREGRVLIWMSGYNKWAEMALVSKKPRKPASKSRFNTTEFNVESGLSLSPPPLI